MVDKKKVKDALHERGIYYYQTFQDAHDEETKRLVSCILAAHLHGVSVGFKLAERIVDTVKDD